MAFATEGLRIAQNTPSAPKGEMLYGILARLKPCPFKTVSTGENSFSVNTLNFAGSSVLCYQMSVEAYAVMLLPCLLGTAWDVVIWK